MKGRSIAILVIIMVMLSGCDFAVGNFVWNDVDMDGIQDSEEMGLSGVTVNLYENGGSGAPVAITTTDALGSYDFTFPGGVNSYFVEFELPAGYRFSPVDVGADDGIDSDALPANGSSAVFSAPSVPGGSGDDSIDAGMHLIPEVSNNDEEDGGESENESYSLGNFVWHDVNANGIQDEGEEGLADIQVGLGEVDTSNAWSTTTDTQGFYEFSDLSEGIYQLKFIVPLGYLLTSQNRDSDDALDSDPDPETGLTPQFLLSANGDEWDAGLLPQTSAGPVSYCVGPEIDDFPEGYSPLTGEIVSDPALLELRPVFISTSLFPPYAYPPQGLSVSPLAFQVYIGEGDTRVLAAYYGKFPPIVFEPELSGLVHPVPGGSMVIGDFVWFDVNGNSLQDEGEPGVPRIQVTLYVNGKTFATTETDDLGHYYFDYSDAEDVLYLQLEFDIPDEYPGYFFVPKGADRDSEINSDVFVEGFTNVLYVTADVNNPDLRIDVGLRRFKDRIDGVRSGRLFYEDIRQQYCACLITAGADVEVSPQIQTCAFATNSESIDDQVRGIDIIELGFVVRESSEGHVCANPNLSANLFCSEATIEGVPGQELRTIWNFNNRDHFVYDPAIEAYTWAKTLPSDNEAMNIMTDGLNGETLTYENVIVMLATMTQINDLGTIFEMDLQHTTGKAYFFRNGRMYEGQWSSIGGDYEQSSGLLRPYRFLDENGNPFALAPGQTFIQLMHSYHSFEELSPGVWKARFFAPVYNP